MFALAERPVTTGRRYVPDDVYWLLDDWSRWADTLAPASDDTGYDLTIGRSNIPNEAAFVDLAARYGELDRHLGYQPLRQAEAVRLYFRGAMDTDPRSRTCGQYFKLTEVQVGKALRVRTAIAGSLIFNGVRDLVASMCRLPFAAATSETSAWWRDRNRGFNRINSYW